MLELFRGAIDLVYPRQCLECGSLENCRNYSFLCDRCFKETAQIEPPFCELCAMPFHGEVLSSAECPNCREMKIWFDKAFAVMRFRGVVRNAIHSFKYSQQMYWGRVLQRWMSQGVERYPELHDVDLLLPVPLHSVRQRERGFNQASVLVNALERILQKSSCTKTLKRIRSTETQTHLDREERMQNLNGAFKVQNPKAVSGKRVLLIDDVLTTGSTVSECAKVLKHAGATSVLVFALARG
jgi:competence protein ComFC